MDRRPFQIAPVQIEAINAAQKVKGGEGKKGTKEDEQGGMKDDEQEKTPER